METTDKDIRFIARFYREDALNTNRAWQQLGIDRKKQKPAWYIKAALIAASVCLAIGFCWWLAYDRQDWITIASTAQDLKEVTLPDGTRITLDKNTELRYDRLAYGKKERRMQLSGRAYFDVTHREACPFMVETTPATVRVLGTRFSVAMGQGKTTAAVEEGKVSFCNRAGQEAILTRGMRASAYSSGTMEVEEKAGPNAFAWKTQVLVYDRTPLKEVIGELEEVYGIRIGHVPPTERLLTATFDHTPIEEIIEIINQTLDTKLDITK